MNNHAQHLYCQLRHQFTNPHHHTSFQTLLSSFLRADGRPQPRHASGKSASALSRFLNRYPWPTRRVIRAARHAVIDSLLALDRHRRGRRPWLRAIVDLTSLEKRGFFHDLGFVRRYHTTYGLHLVVLYLVVGPWRVPWGWRVYRGRGHPNPSRLALRLLRTLPPVLTARYRVVVLADAGFDNQTFFKGVRQLGLDAVVSVRPDRRLHDETPLRKARSGARVRIKDVPFLVTLGKYTIKRANGTREKRLAVATHATSRRMVTRWGRRRWAIEALFKTLKERFGLARFGQSTRLGVYRFLLLGVLAFVLSQFRVWHNASWPDWREAARQVRRVLLPEVVREELLWELERLKPFLPAEAGASLT